MLNQTFEFKRNKYTKHVVLSFIIVLAFGSAIAQSDTSLTQRLEALTKNEVFTINSLVQSGFRYSFTDDDFQGGRLFEVANARFSIKGNFDGGFYYRIFFNFAGEPNLLDAYVGYRVNDALRFTMGAMKPSQTLDYIPGPEAIDFYDRAQITGYLVQAREIGLSAEGDIGGLYYFAGLFNGTRMANSNNKFYGIGRLQYTFVETLTIGIHGSHGNSQGVRSGNRGPVLRGERTIYGSDLELKTNKLMFKAEYLAGDIESADLTDKKEHISGYYFTAGYQAFEKTMLLARWQNWAFRENAFSDSQLTLGVNHNFTEIFGLQFNYDSYFPESGDMKHGISLCLQIFF
jgi:hypothetical protein